MKTIKTFNTAIGNLTESNLGYLVNQKLLIEVNGEYQITNEQVVSSSLTRPVKLWSLYCLVYDYIKEETSRTNQNAIIKVMRQTMFSLKSRGLEIASSCQANEKSKGRKKKEYDWSGM